MTKISFILYHSSSFAETINDEHKNNINMVSLTHSDGFDARFGKSAIKAYRSYIDPKPSKMAAVKQENVDVASNRYARQIDFLAKRHRSREAEWVRHIDTSDSRRTFPLILVLDNLRSAANVGSIYRSADACGCLEILTTGITPHPGGNGAEKLAKSALGAERIVTSRHFMTTKQALDFLREERPNLRLFGMETTERSKCYTSVEYPGPSDTAASDNISSEKEEDPTQAAGVVLFLGNEVSGVDTEIMPLLDEGTILILSTLYCLPTRYCFSFFIDTSTCFLEQLLRFQCLGRRIV